MQKKSLIYEWFSGWLAHDKVLLGFAHCFWVCPKASCYPLLYLVLWLRDKTYQPPSYLMHDLWSPLHPLLPGLRWYSVLLGHCKGSELKKVQAPSDIPGRKEGRGEGLLLCWDHTFSEHLRHFSCCLKAIRMLVWMKVRCCYVRSLVGMASWKLSEQSLL